MSKGWHNEYERHALAGMGVKTGQKQAIKEWNSITGMAKLKALSNYSLEHPLTDAQYNEMMRLKRENLNIEGQMNNAKVKKIETKAKALMRFDGVIWKKYGWQSGDDVNQKEYDKEVEKYLKENGKVDGIQYHILEDANFHSLHESINRLNGFSKNYKETEGEWKAYQDAGGRTWEL